MVQISRLAELQYADMHSSGKTSTLGLAKRTELNAAILLLRISVTPLIKIDPFGYDNNRKETNEIVFTKLY